MAYINVNGLGDLKQQDIQSYLEKFNIDILCITEHKKRDPEVVDSDVNASQGEYAEIHFLICVDSCAKC